MESSNSPSSVLEDLERTFVASDRSGFETVLFSAIKSAALSTCQPKVATAEDAAASLSSQSIDETSIEAELFEYNKLLDSIFAAFEDFLANSEIPECGSAGGSVGDDNDSLSRLKKKLGVVCPKVRTPCGQIFMDQEPTFRCKDCSTDPTCALCRTCFFASIHANHRYKPGAVDSHTVKFSCVTWSFNEPPRASSCMKRYPGPPSFLDSPTSGHISDYPLMHASGGGYCDCGDEEAWTSGAWCRIHAGEGDVETGDGKSSGADTFRSVSEELNLEMELVRSRLSKLPVDVIRRCTYLLEPLVNSASVVLFELLQGSPRTDYPALSSTHSKQEVGAEKPRDFDTAEAECFWPPPLSHLPSTSASEDASQLGIGHFPHTCPSNRDAGHMEARCLAQQSRAHRLHPALFDSVDGDVVSGVKNHYTVILYNNEYHNYEDVSHNKDVYGASDSRSNYHILLLILHPFLNLPLLDLLRMQNPHVIKTVRRLDGCTAKQATLFAIIVNRDGRTPLLTHLTRQSACEKAARVSVSSLGLHIKRGGSKAFSEVFVWTSVHSASTRHMIRPLRSSAMDHRVYALESFFVSVLRWLQRLASSVHALRPLICNAILGRFALTTSEAAEVIRLPGEMMLPNCLLAHILERFTLSHRGTLVCLKLGVRKTASRLIAGVFLQEPYHRRIFSIEFTRHFETICQAYIYDDHLEADNLFALTCQFYTVISLVSCLQRALNASTSIPLIFLMFLLGILVLQRILSRLARTVAHNSQPLPAFYEVSHSNITLASLLSPKLPALPSVFETRLRALRSANPQAWARAHEALTSGEAEPRAFVWRHVPDERPEFCPFERILHTTYDLRYVLTSLLNVRPLAGESSKCPSSWWGVNARKNFMVFFRTLLEMLGNLQDMNGMQRAVRIHVEIEQEWISTFKMMSHLIYVLNLTVQVASSDRVLLIEAIKETREAYEKRVGLFDRCFRVKPFDGPYASSEGINGLTVQCLGATSEIYEYDVSAFRVSVMQPLPRLLAALYGHALEMGLSPVQVGLADEGFANLIIERPLQTISFVAQCSANFWVRNGLIVENIIYNMYNGLRVEMVDRNYQLLQQAATVLPADELIVRMIHKLNLHEFMCGELSHVKPGTVQFVEALLRTILYLVTHRSRDGVGYFDPLIVSSTPSSLNLFPEKLNEIDEYLEANYGQLIDDVVHALCTKAMTHSELFSALPHQPPGCVLRKPPPYQPSNSEEDTRLNMRGSRKDTIERPLAKILQQIATPATSGSKQVFSIKPEVILSRFNRFYPGYKHTDQTVAEENVARVLKKWLQEPGNPVALRCRGLPVPPPPPRPRRRFVRPMEKPLLQLVRCTTFVRLVRRLLDAELSYGRVQSWWSETINELVLHLIIVALYEDAITFAEKGEKPFLDVVSRVPNTAESDAELENLAASRHWTKQQTPASPSSSSPTKWTLKLWDDVVAKPHDEAFAGVVEVKNVDSPTSEKQRKLEAKRQRQAKILDKMSEMQRKFLEAHCQEMSNVEENDTPMDTTPPPGSASSTSHPSTLEDSSDRAVALFSAMGPHRFEERRCQLEEKVKTTVTCVLCLEEIPESDKHNVVVAAYGCRSNVLSMPLFHGEAVDFVNETCQSDCVSGGNCYNSEYNLAAIATTAVAASLGSNESNMTQLPRLVCGVNAAGEDASPTKPSGSSDSNQSHAAPSAKPNSLDPWFPRPLVSSRCPVGEEGTFISTCPHLMHAGCKERYAAQLKSQNEQLTRQHRYANKPPLYEFRCSLCRSLANFDVPLFGRLHDTLPEAWVARCLKKPFDFANWLKTLHTWLKDCSCLPSAPLQQVTFNMSELPDAPESFTNLFVALGDSFSQHCDDLLAKICASCERAFCKPDPESAAEDEEEVEEPEDDGRPPSTPRRIRLCLSRGLFRRFLLRRSETVPSEDSSAHPSRSTSTLPLVFVPLLQRPPQDSVKVSADLWTFVQRLVTISQPKPIQSLQRNAMRAQFLESGNLVTEILQALNNAQEAVNLVVNANLEGDDEAFGEDDGMEGGGGETAIETVLSHRPPADRRHSSIGGSGVDDGGLPPSLSEAAEELHTSLVSSYSHLMVLSGKDETTAGTGRHLTQSISRLKAALVCTRRRSFQAILAAACEWRALRHSIAYTLVIWERCLRQLGPDNNFFNGYLADRHKLGLGYLMRAAFHAHARLAPVSRCAYGPESSPSQKSWSRCLHDPSWWWWYCYFAPEDPKQVSGCCYPYAVRASYLIENVTRIAVTQDAGRLWRLLLPDSHALAGSSSSAPPSTQHLSQHTAMEVDECGTLPSSHLLEQPPLSPDALNVPASLLWEVDITFLFLNLLFLRPGVESADQQVECQRIAVPDSANSEDEKEERLPAVMCDEGFPRLPMGDAHEAFALRVCHLALLVQALLSWQPDRPSQTPSSSALLDPCAPLWMNEKVRPVAAFAANHMVIVDSLSPMTMHCCADMCFIHVLTLGLCKSLSQLLTVRRRLQHLSGLPVCSIQPSPATLSHLFAHIHAHCLPFLRVAAFAIYQITGVDVPPALSNPSHQKPSSTSVFSTSVYCEFSLLLAYLGLSQSPSDLLVLLSDSEAVASPHCTTIDETSASSSLWLASLMTSWCLLGRNAISRGLYSNWLKPKYLPNASSSHILPEPHIRVPHLIQLPKQYVSLMALATELKTVHTGSNIHSDPSLCLVCGAVACFACYSCRRFEQVAEITYVHGGASSSSRREAVVYDMQAHARRFHSGYAIVMLFSGRVLLFSEQARRTTELPTPYRDEFGETDVGLRRGNPLFLDEKAYEELNRIWLSHRMNSATTSNLYLV
ncbi:unnamed protein product [Mesocestoides corti]|uniref:E3 ubiquitin-protein ligase n=1 Tax=Mesocestoides corti TaxID=53468 RepID=A0A158QS83_MESCO|nr:unnamed protein product [Mesocestoides corti]